jgi:hypothetical protein
MRIALICDVFVSSSPTAEGRSDGFKDVIEQINDGSIDIVLIAAGLTLGGEPGELEAFEQSRRMIAPPTHVVPGAADFRVADDNGQDGSVIAARLHRYRDTVGRDYYQMRIGPDVELIALNGALIGTGTPDEVSQSEWFERVLSSGESRHRVLLIDRLPEMGRQEGSTDESVLAPMASRLHELLTSGDIELVFTGSAHRNERDSESCISAINARPVTQKHDGEVSGKTGWTLIEYVPGESPTITQNDLEH